MRRRRGLGGGKTVSLDRVTLTSRRLGLTGRPDRLDQGGWHDHRRGMEIIPAASAFAPGEDGVYFLLVEEELRIRPTHGFIVCGDGTRHRIENTRGAASLGARPGRADSGGEGER